MEQNVDFSGLFVVRANEMLLQNIFPINRNQLSFAYTGIILLETALPLG